MLSWLSKIHRRRGKDGRELFEMARQKAPSIIFIDEIDSIDQKRLDVATSGDREVQRTLMQLLSGIGWLGQLGQR